MNLETPRLLLRNVQESDESEYLAFHNSEFVLRYNAMQKETPDQAHALLEKYRSDDRFVAIEQKESGLFVGMIYVEEDSLRYRANSQELSYWLGEPFAQQGIMSEAMEALIHHLFFDVGYSSVTVRVFADNAASQKLMHRLGFRQEGHLHRAVLGYDGQLHDDLLFSRTREEA